MQENIILLLLISLLLAIIGVSYYMYSKYCFLDTEISYIKETISQDEEKVENSEKNLTNDLLNFQEELAEYMNHHNSDVSDSSSESGSENMELEFYNNLNNNVIIEELEHQELTPKNDTPEETCNVESTPVQEEISEKKTRKYNKKQRTSED